MSRAEVDWGGVMGDEEVVVVWGKRQRYPGVGEGFKLKGE